MRMEMSHDITDDGSAFDGRLGIEIALIEHIEDDTSLNRFKTISCIRNGTVCDDFFRVAVEGTDQNIAHVAVDDVFRHDGRVVFQHRRAVPQI